MLQHSTSSTAGDLLVRPMYPTVMPTGKLCVSDAGTHRLVLLSAAGKRIKQPKRMPVLSLPTGIACSDSSLYVADQGTHQVHRLDISDFSPAGIAGGPGSSAGATKGNAFHPIDPTQRYPIQFDPTVSDLIRSDLI